MTAEPTTDHRLFEGICRGGPLDGETATSRFPAGFVLADKLAGRAWIYDRRHDGTYVVRGGDPDPARELDHTKALAAVLGQEYDVIRAVGVADHGRA